MQPGDAQHALYRYFDDDGDLLYVGITNDPSRRWGQHTSSKPWWHEVGRVEFERYPSRTAVLIAERTAIKEEGTALISNVVHCETSRRACTISSRNSVWR